MGAIIISIVVLYFNASSWWVKIRRTFRAHWNKITHLWNYNLMKNRLVCIWMRWLFASVGQLAKPSHRYIFDSGLHLSWSAICGLSLIKTIKLLSGGFSWATPLATNKQTTTNHFHGGRIPRLIPF